MTLQEVMSELEAMGSESTKKILVKHGAVEPFFGVKVGDLKKIQKKIKKDQQLALDLYATGNGDAMYLAGLIADETKMTPEILDRWVEKARWSLISESTVAWLAADSGLGEEMGEKWIKSEREHIAAAGWSALTNHISITPDKDLFPEKYSQLLDHVAQCLHKSENRVRYTMNGFVIGVGSYIPELTEKSMDIAGKIGKVSVDMNGTACKVPDAIPYIEKIRDMGRLGKKRKMARC